MNHYDLHHSLTAAADSRPDDRARFVSRTYAHLAGAVLAFMAVETLLLRSPVADAMLQVLGMGNLAWLVVLGVFMGVTWFAQNLANRSASLGVQYAGLGLYVLAQGMIFVPILAIATRHGGPNTVATAAAITGALFLGLTVVAFTTRKDFNFLGAILKIGGLVALGFIAASMIFGFNLGLLFAAVMVVFASAAILYETSNIMFRYSPQQYVAASLALFASVMLLFWYVLRIVMGRRD
jgi:FtsH-binding integral membrane protein